MDITPRRARSDRAGSLNTPPETLTGTAPGTVAVLVFHEGPSTTGALGATARLPELGGWQWCSVTCGAIHAEQAGHCQGAGAVTSVPPDSVPVSRQGRAGAIALIRDRPNGEPEANSRNPL